MRNPITPFSRARRAVALASLLFGVAGALTACSDPFKLKAQYANEPFTYSVYGMSGTAPANAPSALDLTSRAVVKVDGSFNFDIAFDVDSKGKIMVIPQRLVGTPVSGSRTVALQRLSGGYEAVTEAPTRNWLLDSALTISTGDVVGIRITSLSCMYQMSNDMYAKLVIDSVKASGLIYGRGVLNPNCGFKSFAAGIPEK